MRNKMPATINAMELIHADDLTPDQLMINDLIGIEDGIVEVKTITSDATGDKYSIDCQNEFGEIETVEFNFDSLIKLFVFIEHDE
jgi:hypothetical protein